MVGLKNKPPVAAVEKSRIRSVLPGGSPMNMLAGIGENAGVVDVGDGWAVTFKVESHNHPSYVEPYQGAATGVGGIVRDIMLCCQLVG